MVAIARETIDEIADASFSRPAGEASVILPFTSTTLNTLRRRVQFDFVRIRTDRLHNRILGIRQVGKLLCMRLGPSWLRPNNGGRGHAKCKRDHRKKERWCSAQASAFRECYRNVNCEDLYDLDQFFGELILINSSRIPEWTADGHHAGWTATSERAAADHEHSLNTSQTRQ
jgi:hypothetical protein